MAKTHPTPQRSFPQDIFSVYIAFVFIQSLFFKFSGSAETDHIFLTLDRWGGSLGLPGLFAPGGISSAHVIGSAELIASILLLVGLFGRYRLLRLAGALMALGIISGAILFHLFTPLGVVVLNDGGLLFAMACGVWIAAAAILWANRRWMHDWFLSLNSATRKA